jgi:tetratricopeptide (TPR) repeat protein
MLEEEFIEDLKVWDGRFSDWQITHPLLMTYGTQAAMFVHQETSRIVNAQVAAADRIVVSQDRIKSGIDTVALNLERVNDGIEGLQATFNEAMGEFIWRIEQQTETLKEILKVIQEPLTTQAIELKKRAVIAHHNGWIEEAIKDFKAAEKMNRYDYTIYMNLGFIFFARIKNKPKTAIEYFKKAVKYAIPYSNEHASFALFYIGVINYIQGNFKQAYNATKEAIKLYPEFYEAYYDCARYCANLGRYDEAITHLSKAIKGDRYYCVKADSEKDFNPMKEQLHSLFKDMQKNARLRASQEIDEAEKSVKFAYSLTGESQKSQSPYETKFSKYKTQNKLVSATNELENAKNFLKNGSLFDCQDAISKAHIAKTLAVTYSYDYLNKQNTIMAQEKEKQQGEWKNYKHKQRWNYGLAFFELLILGPIGAILIGLFLHNITHNFGIAAFGGFIGYLLCSFGVAALYTAFTDRRGDSKIEKINTHFKDKIDLIEKKRSELYRITSMFKTPIGSVKTDNKDNSDDGVSEEEVAAGLGALFD